MKKGYKCLRRTAAFVLAAAIIVTGTAFAGVAPKPALAETKVLDSAISTVSFSDAKKGIKDMHTDVTSSNIAKDPEMGSVLKLGTLKRDAKKSSGVELVNPYVGKTQLVETLAQALRNNGVVYNGTTADETKFINNQYELEPLDMPLEGRTYPFPKWTTGVTVSMWVKVPETFVNPQKDINSWDNVPILFSFNREDMVCGVGTMAVGLNGDVLFFGGSAGDSEEGGSAEIKNAFDLIHDKDKTEKRDAISGKGKWVYITVVFENDWISMYYDGLAAEGTIKTTKYLLAGANSSKCFNKGFSYRGAPREEIYKNWSRMLHGFTEEERAANDFTNFEHYEYQNADRTSIMEYITDEDTSLYLGGSYIQSWYSNATYLDALDGVMIDEVSFFDKPLSAEQVAKLYGEVSGNEVILPTGSPEPAGSAEPVESEEPSESPSPGQSSEPVESEEPSESPSPSRSPEPVESEEPSESPSPSQTPEPVESEEPSESPSPSRSPEPVESEEPSEAPAEWFYGDVNQNNEVTSEDALAILKHVVKLTPISDELALKLADADESGTVDSGDALEVLKIVVKLKEAKKYHL